MSYTVHEIVWKIPPVSCVPTGPKGVGLRFRFFAEGSPSGARREERADACLREGTWLAISAKRRVFSVTTTVDSASRGLSGMVVVMILLVIGFEGTWSQALTETRPKMGDIDGVGTAAYKVHSRYKRSPKRTCLNQKDATDTYVHSSITLAQTHVCSTIPRRKKTTR